MSIIAFVYNFAVLEINLVIVRPSMTGDVRTTFMMLYIFRMLFLSGDKSSASFSDVALEAVRAINFVNNIC